MEDGDFWFQVGLSSPGSVSLKYQHRGKLNPTTLKDENLHRLLDSGLYAEMCKEAGFQENLFQRLVLSEEHGYHFVAVSELQELVNPSPAHAAPRLV